MDLVVRPAPPCLGCDTVAEYTDAALDALWAHGVRAFGMYVETATLEQLARITARGGGVWFVGEAREAGTWTPSAATGAVDAARHLAKLHALAIPPGASMFLDCETPDPKSPTPGRIDHVDSWAQPMASALFLSGAYVGADYGLTSAEWQARPSIHRYWASCSMLRDYQSEVIEPARGWSGLQRLPFNYRIGPITVDLSMLCHDYHGDAFALVYDAAHAP